ncbi:uncharacterized protein TM35_000052660 [Trypanosoma theileri]|uniref:Uncharacterized protein n=1 Tax=Trypanosoma theileri TaxID=67003 RepID=A0A1X0P5H0_9TRYP|nr:uncharacterized protein TM35_000052660 [Trypanosoma theileri]ORC91670.1 hypothetical protein TM35_000052660 [Trypanosoma theileri]
MSYVASSEGYVRGDDNISRRSERLRSGAMAMSRSALTHTEVLEDKIVDLGDGVMANFYEHLLARLEQHGLRRCLANEREDDDNNNTNKDDTNKNGMNVNHDMSLDEGKSNCASTNTPGEPRDSIEEDAREPYYYLCVPCELPITKVSSRAATLSMLQDAHYHLCSAEHRRIASWMGEPDIDFTLQNSSELDPSGYTRIHVNGIPMLLSTRPGGGDMFFPLPHEINERDRSSPSGMDTLLTATEPHTEMWYRPLESIFTETKQMLYTTGFDGNLRTRRWDEISRKRSRFILQHISKEKYEKESFVEGETVPALFEIKPQRLPKKSNNGTQVSGCRLSYTVSKKPIMVWDSDVDPTLNRAIVKNDGVYRVVLIKASEAARILSDKSYLGVSEEPYATENNGQVLTMEALSHVRGTSTVCETQSDFNWTD